ncbi:hypothetical protein ILUMI_25779, partial [Ignelater luminosus]
MIRRKQEIFSIAPRAIATTMKPESEQRGHGMTDDMIYAEYQKKPIKNGKTNHEQAACAWEGTDNTDGSRDGELEGEPTLKKTTSNTDTKLGTCSEQNITAWKRRRMLINEKKQRAL